MFLVFLGPPGCGKGTQSQFLAGKYDFSCLAIGQLLRDEVVLSTPLGLEIAQILSSGGYVDDAIILDIIKKNLLQSPSKNVLFDGFPRTLMQAEFFDSILKVQGKKLDRAIYFSINEEALFERIVGRFNCVQCKRVYHDQNNKPQVEGICDFCQGTVFSRRVDDTEESLNQRLKVYYETVGPLIEFYKKKDCLVEIDASQSLEQVNKQLLAIIQPYFGFIKE